MTFPLNADQARLVLLVIELMDHLPEPIKAEAAAELEEIWRLHESIQSDKG